MMSLFSRPKGSRPVHLRKAQIRDAHQTAGCNLIRQQDLSINFFFQKLHLVVWRAGQHEKVITWLVSSYVRVVRVRTEDEDRRGEERTSSHQRGSVIPGLSSPHLSLTANISDWWASLCEPLTVLHRNGVRRILPHHGYTVCVETRQRRLHLSGG